MISVSVESKCIFGAGLILIKILKIILDKRWANPGGGSHKHDTAEEEEEQDNTSLVLLSYIR